jgi:hypothetical protein
MVRTVTTVVGADTVHEHYFIPSSKRNVLGAYQFDGGKFTVQASAQNGTSTGFFWLINPVGATILVGIHKVQIIQNFSTNLTVPTQPRLQLSRFTFTGTASGAAETYALRDSTDAAAQSTLRTASTGMSVTLGNAFWSTLVPFAAGTAGWQFVPPFLAEFVEEGEVGQMIIRPGEGIVLWQPDAGTASDTRQFVTNFCIQEFE